MWILQHLWGGGGAPFKTKEDGDLTDRAGTNVELMGIARQIFKELHQADKWKNTKLAFASGCDEPSWAKECFKRFKITDETSLGDVVKTHCIDKRGKREHIKELMEKLEVTRLEDVLFFDNEKYNCTSVASLGVTVVHCPKGLTEAAWKGGLKHFPSPGQVFKL